MVGISADLIASYELRNTIHFQAGYVRNSCDHRNEGIEFLQLYQQWSLDTSNHTRTSTQRLQLHGVGCEFEADAPSCYRKEGERIQWAVWLTPLRELLALPVRQA